MIQETGNEGQMDNLIPITEGVIGISVTFIQKRFQGQEVHQLILKKPIGNKVSLCELTPDKKTIQIFLNGEEVNSFIESFKVRNINILNIGWYALFKKAFYLIYQITDVFLTMEKIKKGFAKSYDFARGYFFYKKLGSRVFDEITFSLISVGGTSPVCLTLYKCYSDLKGKRESCGKFSVKVFAKNFTKDESGYKII